MPLTITGSDPLKTVNEILVEAARLSNEDLFDLHAGVKRLVHQVRSFDLTPHGKRHWLTPLDEMEFHQLRRRSIAIKESSGYWLATCHRDGTSERLTLPQAYIVLREKCGQGRPWLDDYKQAYAFPFEMRITHCGRDFPYLFEFSTYKGSFEQSFARSATAEKIHRKTERNVVTTDKQGPG